MTPVFVRLLIASLFYFTLFCAGSVYAKEVNLEWKPIKYAIKYEIKISKDGKPFKKKSLDEPNWSGELGFGLYDYEIRAIDKLDRPGQWSKARPLVVMPASPELTSPKDGEKVIFYDPRAKATFSWKEVPGITSYKFSLIKDKKVLAELTLKNTQAQISSLPSGEYQWRVKAVITGAGKKIWESPTGELSSVEIDQKKLEKPIPSYPRGEITAEKTKKYKFKWSKVAGATGYVIHLHSLEGRVPAADKTINVKDVFTEVEVPVEGQFKWDVSAVANVDAKGSATATSGTSTTQFKIVHPTPFPEGDSSVSLAAFYAPISLNETSPSYQMKANTKTTSSGFKLNGEYFFVHNLGVGLSMMDQEIQVDHVKDSMKTFELSGKYRMQIGSPSSGYFFYPKVGVEKRDYVMYLAYRDPNNNPSISSSSTTALGAEFGLDLRKQFTDKFGLSAQLQYFYPLSVSSGDQQESVHLKSNSANFENVTVGMQGSYWWTQSISMSLGAFLEFKSLAFSREGQNTVSSNDPETVNLNSQYLVLSMSYSFGK